MKDFKKYKKEEENKEFQNWNLHNFRTKFKNYRDLGYSEQNKI